MFRKFSPAAKHIEERIELELNNDSLTAQEVYEIKVFRRDLFLFVINKTFRRVNSVLNSDLSRLDKLDMIQLIGDSSCNALIEELPDTSSFDNAYKVIRPLYEELSSYVFSVLDAKIKRAIEIIG